MAQFLVAFNRQHIFEVPQPKFFIAYAVIIHSTGTQQSLASMRQIYSSIENLLLLTGF